MHVCHNVVSPILFYFYAILYCMICATTVPNVSRFHLRLTRHLLILPQCVQCYIISIALQLNYLIVLAAGHLH